MSVRRVCSFSNGVVAFGAVVLVTPIGMTLRAWRARMPIDLLALLVLLGSGLAVLAVFPTGSWW